GLARPEGVESLIAAGRDAGALDATKREALLRAYRTIDPGWRKLNDAVQAHLAQAPKPKTEKMLISSEGVPAVRLHTQGDDFLKETHFLKRGDPGLKDGVAAPGFLQVLMNTPAAEKRWQAAPPPGWRTSYRRRALAGWITDTEAGAGHLLARVIVNRLWQHHMGRGIVATPSDFGAQGEKPTHPELLDWLARELIRNGWRLKPIHRLMMTSAVYLQSSRVEPAKAKADPANKLFGRHPRRRLEAEVIRDSMLAVSGLLDRNQFGPGTLDESHKRRSIYFTVKRSKLVPVLQIFDAPDALQGMAVRSTTTVAPQALLLLNNSNVRDYARSFAKRIAPKPDTPHDEAVRAGYVTALGRQPTAAELADTTAFLQAQVAASRAAGAANAEEQALADFCQVLMGLNEFVYID
ncbi:MAG TPA: DUF1553 domain-containing protein, partial [Armatimonadota bacterium]|nr:DUF1553 domain-containing protein [Armatimonadota bacterium]